MAKANNEPSPKVAGEKKALGQWDFEKLLEETNVEFRKDGDERPRLVGPKEDLQRWTEFEERWRTGQN